MCAHSHGRGCRNFFRLPGYSLLIVSLQLVQLFVRVLFRPCGINSVLILLVLDMDTVLRLHIYSVYQLYKYMLIKFQSRTPRGTEKTVPSNKELTLWLRR